LISVSAAIAWVAAATSLAIAATYLATRRTRHVIGNGETLNTRSGEPAGATGADSALTSVAPRVNDLLTTIAACAERLIISTDPSTAGNRDAHEIRQAALSALQLNQRLPTTLDVNTAIAEAGSSAEDPSPAAHVLVVDDEPGMREFIRLVLTRAGHEVVTVSSADAALDALQRRPAISLMLVDVIMPAMDGYELVAEARKIAPKVSVVLMSAFAPDPDRHLMGDAFLAKPFSGESLTGVVDRLLSA
jgi:CheY-like chemotaxis protein